MNIRENVKISELVTMKIGGTARYVVEIEKEEDVQELLDFLKAHSDLDYYVLGAGANTFATDEDFNGIIIQNKITGVAIGDNPAAPGKNYHVFVYGGTNWDDLVEAVVKEGYTGIECLAGIPGTVGAAPVQNIGAYGQEVKDVIYQLIALDLKTGEKKIFFPEDCDFSYRHSIFNSSARNRYLILSVGLELEKGEIKTELYKSLQTYLDEKNIKSRDPKIIADAVRKIRDSKLPKPEEEPSSGSFFKNIYVSEDEIEDLDKREIPHHGTKVNTAYLIEKSGLKGKTFHGFRVSEKAPLVLINDSAKSYEDLEKAVKEISKIVEEKFGFKLEQEPNVIGKKNG